MIKRWLVRVGLWVARLGGWQPCTAPHLPEDAQIELARQIVHDVETRVGPAPGPVKAREALRCLLNLRPEAKVSDLNLLIELALTK